MTGKILLAMLGDLEKYLTAFDEDMKRKENRAHLRRYARGQLGTIERKSLEPMADADGINPRRLQCFLTRHGWDASGVRDRLQRKVTLEHGGADGIFVIDETSDAKKGRTHRRRRQAILRRKRQNRQLHRDRASCLCAR